VAGNDDSLRRARIGTRDFDVPAALEHLRAKDPVLGKIVDRVGPFSFELQKTSSTFGALAEAIVYQQLSPRAAATIFGRVRALFPDAGNGLEPEHIMSTDDLSLRSAGLSGAKLLSLRDLARRTVEGTVPTLRRAQKMDDQEIIERLVEVRGIGPWTAQMFLMFRLGRPDVLPLDDYGLRRGFAVAFKKRELPEKADVAKRGLRWAPYRSVASWYLWRMAEDRPGDAVPIRTSGAAGRPEG
jgi:3-methyladenine DNA glycosylase/8-oxoguanine DNA glycosylase